MILLGDRRRRAEQRSQKEPLTGASKTGLPGLPKAPRRAEGTTIPLTRVAAYGIGLRHAWPRGARTTGHDGHSAIKGLKRCAGGICIADPIFRAPEREPIGEPALRGDLCIPNLIRNNHLGS